MPTKRKKTKTNILARILIKKSGDKESRDRQILVQWAKTMQFCRQPYEDPDTHRTHNLKHCKLALCPTCQTRKAKRNRDFLYKQFEEYTRSRRLFETRLDLPRGNLSGKELHDAMRMIAYAWKRLTQSADWRKEVRLCAAVIHLPWKSASDSHPAGYWLHLNIICLTRNKRPDVTRIASEWKTIRNSLGPFNGRSRHDALYWERVRRLRRTCVYFTHVKKRIAGYPQKKGAPWLLWKIPDNDVVEYVRAVRYRLRVCYRGFDRDVAKCSKKG